MYGSIEGGGTKFVVALGDEKGNIILKKSFPTRSPKETVKDVLKFFKNRDIKGLGIGTFGPCDVNVNSKTYGHLTKTPKKDWMYYDLLGEIKKLDKDIDYVFDTDVNIAGLGEYYLGNGRGKNSLLYLTVGTGVGGGFIQNGKAIKGINHPEMGHVLIRKDPNDDFKGTCPYHVDCLESLACGLSIEKRFGKKAQEIHKDDTIFEYISDYIAQALISYTVILRPENITLGGGVMKVEGLIDKIRNKFLNYFNEYLEIPPIEEYIKTPFLKDNAGIIGGIISVMTEDEKKELK